MKLDYSHFGRQFFFITLTVAGRAKILSRLVDGVARPLLSEVGEVVKAALLAFHRVNPALTVSDFVIMPDHVHFILIIDYERDRRASPLYLAHRLVDAVEMFLERTGLRPEPEGEAGDALRTPLATAYAARFVRGIPEPEGEAGDALRTPLATAYAARFVRGIPEPEGEAGDALRLEPRGAVDGEAMRDKLAQILREVIAAETATWRKGDERASPHCPVFDRSCYIELSFDSRQLRAIRHYIKLNPARALWKLRHPDRFRRVEIPIEKVLGGPAGGSGLGPVHCSHLHAMGDITLLGSPFFFHVRLTLKKTLAEHERAIAEIVAEARRGRIPVSGFISPGEREAFRRLKATPGVRFVKMLPHALPPRYDPSAEDSREIAAGRLLLLSGCPETPPISALDMRRSSSAGFAFRRNCLAMNELASAMCKR